MQHFPMVYKTLSIGSSCQSPRYGRLFYKRAQSCYIVHFYAADFLDLKFCLYKGDTLNLVLQDLHCLHSSDTPTATGFYIYF